VDGATIQQRIYAGRGKAAQRIGLMCKQYRPLTAAAPLGNQVASILAAFNAGDSTYRAPNSYGDAVWYADFDANASRVGDYLVRTADAQAFFIAALQPLLPIEAVACDRKLKVQRQAGAGATVGLQSYGSSSPCDPAGMADLLGTSAAMWPASILLGGKSREPGTGLPSSAKQSGWRILLPASVPAVLNAGDIATDDLGRRYLFEACELTDMGWRINAQEVHA